MCGLERYALMKRRQVYLTEGVTPLFSTDGPNQHFFGYYDKSPFDASGRFMLSHRVCGTSNALPGAGDRAELVCWDIENSSSTVLASTATFNWQQGAMLQWVGPDFGSTIIFNDHRDGRYVSVMLDRETGRERVLPLPVYSLSSDGRWALCVDFDRLFWCRRGYAYACGGDSRKDVDVPEDSGISLMDLTTGAHELVVSTRQMYDTHHVPAMEQGANYLEHVAFSPSGKRFILYHRWRLKDGGIVSRAYVAGRNGVDVRMISDVGELSHYAWRNKDELLLFGAKNRGLNRIRHGSGMLTRCVKNALPVYRKLFRSETFLERKLILRRNYFIVDVVTGGRRDLSAVGMDLDGHPSFQPGDSGCFLSDTYPDGRGMQHLYIYSISKEQRLPLGRFRAPPEYRSGPVRCDLHPRWDRSGRRVCIDSAHTGTRQVHVYTVSDSLRGRTVTT